MPKTDEQSLKLAIAAAATLLALLAPVISAMALGAIVFWLLKEKTVENSTILRLASELAHRIKGAFAHPE